MPQEANLKRTHHFKLVKLDDMPLNEAAPAARKRPAGQGRGVGPGFRRAGRLTAGCVPRSAQRPGLGTGREEGMGVRTGAAPGCHDASRPSPNVRHGASGPADFKLQLVLRLQ